MKKYRSIVISELIWKTVDAFISSKLSDKFLLETFNNCREQGFVGIDYEDNLVIWTYTNRHSDQAEVVIGTTRNFSDTVGAAAQYIIEVIEKELK